MRVRALGTVNRWIDIQWPLPDEISTRAWEKAEAIKCHHYLLVSHPVLNLRDWPLFSVPGKCLVEFRGPPPSGGAPVTQVMEIRMPYELGPIGCGFDSRSRSWIVVAQGKLIVQAHSPGRLLARLFHLGVVDPGACGHLVAGKVEYVGKTHQSWTGRANRLSRYHHRLSKLGRHLTGLAEPRELSVILLGNPGLQLMACDGHPVPMAEVNDYDELSERRGREIIAHPHWVSAVEAALIRYFEPEWNRTFRYTFPSKRHSSYDWLTRIGLKGMHVELHRMHLTPLHSNRVGRRCIHAIGVHLREEDGFPVLGTKGYSYSDDQLWATQCPEDRIGRTLIMGASPEEDRMIIAE